MSGKEKNIYEQYSEKVFFLVSSEKIISEDKYLYDYETGMHIFISLDFCFLARVY